MNNQIFAKKILPLIDHTNLNTNATTSDIDQLCDMATTPWGSVAAVCVYSQFIRQAKHHLSETQIKIATVCNFPHGMQELKHTLSEIQWALDEGADEIDLVMPYHALSEEKSSSVLNYLIECRALCQNSIFKVILETAVLEPQNLVREASEIVIESGADFIKTSTGMVQGASLAAVKTIIETIHSQPKKIGIKISGGLKSLEHVTPFYQLILSSLGKDFITPDKLRIGSSSLLNDILNILSSS